MAVFWWAVEAGRMNIVAHPNLLIICNYCLFIQEYPEDYIPLFPVQVVSSRLINNRGRQMITPIQPSLSAVLTKAGTAYNSVHSFQTRVWTSSKNPFTLPESTDLNGGVSPEPRNCNKIFLSCMAVLTFNKDYQWWTRWHKDHQSIHHIKLYIYIQMTF